jgi:hypothetical protein
MFVYLVMDFALVCENLNQRRLATGGDIYGWSGIKEFYCLHYPLNIKGGDLLGQPVSLVSGMFCLHLSAYKPRRGRKATWQSLA